MPTSANLNLMSSSVVNDDAIQPIESINVFEVEAEIARLNDEMEVAPPEFFEEVEQLKSDPEVFDALSLAVASFVQGEITQDEFDEQTKGIGISPSMVQILAQKRELSAHIENLKSSIAEQKREVLLQESQHLLSSLSWTNVFRYYIERRNFTENGDQPGDDMLENVLNSDYKWLLTYSAKLREPGTSYDDLVPVQNYLTKLRSSFERRDFLDDPQIVEEVGQYFEEVQLDHLQEQLKTFRNKSANHQTLRSIYRNRNRLAIPSFDLTIYRTFLDKLDGGEYKGLQLPGYVSGLISNWATAYEEEESEISDFEELAEKSRNGDPKELAAKIQIEGIEDEAGQHLVVTKDYLAYQLALKIPPAYLDKIKIISRKPSTGQTEKDQVTVDDNGTVWETAGIFTPEWDEDSPHTLIGCEIELMVPCSVPESDAGNSNYMEFVETIFYEALYHEIGHRIHSELDEDFMSRWITLHRDRVNITPYVELSQKMSVAIGLLEDFAESYMIFNSSPLALITESADRFKYFYELSKKYMTKRQFAIMEYEVGLKLAGANLRLDDFI